MGLDPDEIQGELAGAQEIEEKLENVSVRGPGGVTLNAEAGKVWPARGLHGEQPTGYKPEDKGGVSMYGQGGGAPGSEGKEDDSDLRDVVGQEGAMEMN